MKSLKKFVNSIQKVNSKANKFAYACFMGICDGFNTNSFTTVEGTVDKIHAVVNVAVWGSTFVAASILVYGAYLFITSAGDDGKVEQANNTITAGVIGLIIVFAADLIIKYVIEKIIFG